MVCIIIPALMGIEVITPVHTHNAIIINQATPNIPIHMCLQVFMFISAAYTPQVRMLPNHVLLLFDLSLVSSFLCISGGRGTHYAALLCSEAHIPVRVLLYSLQIPPSALPSLCTCSGTPLASSFLCLDSPTIFLQAIRNAITSSGVRALCTMKGFVSLSQFYYFKRTVLPVEQIPT